VPFTTARGSDAPLIQSGGDRSERGRSLRVYRLDDRQNLGRERIRLARWLPLDVGLGEVARVAELCALRAA
jgi:hypothetical protein